MKDFIFITDEGSTYDPNNKLIENMQLLGSAQGKDILEAFKNFKQAQSYLSEFAFKEVIAVEFVGNFIRNIEL